MSTPDQQPSQQKQKQKQRPPKLPVHPPSGSNNANANANPSSSATDPSGSTAPEKKSQRQMTKAERRELQEKQRAAKAAAKVDGGGGGGDKPSKKDGVGPSRNSKDTPSGGASGSRAPNSPSIPTSASASRAAQASASRGTPLASAGAGAGAGSDDAPRSRGLRIFSHFALQKPGGGGKGGGDVHPAVVRLGLLFGAFRICGANARCIAALTAFKEVIQDYSTPAGTTLARHLNTHLSAQISHLVAARPMAVTMGNAIRQLKLEISGTDIDLPEQDAKDALCDKIDDYIRDRVIIADQVIQETASKKIQDGDVVLTYARSSVVEKVLLQAWSSGTRFSVSVVDSRPLLEGKRLLSVLARAGVPCTYLLLPALGTVIAEASTVFLGAHSIHSNGAVYSRAGTALVAMLARRHSVPVVVCCETYKFSDNVQLDSFTKNELAPPAFARASSAASGGALEVLNPLYDLTPPASITAVVTEVGVIPPDSISSIPLALGRSVL